MRDWLFNIMRDMADREELSPHYLKMEKEAETNFSRKWTNAAIWKWCDLDGHPHDRQVYRKIFQILPARLNLLPQLTIKIHKQTRFGTFNVAILVAHLDQYQPKMTK